MSLIEKILDRLTGIGIVREQLPQLTKQADTLADLALDHEHRLTRLEVVAGSVLTRKKSKAKPRK